MHVSFWDAFDHHQGRSQNLKEVPQNFAKVLNIGNVTANDVIQRNQHRKEKKLEFHSNHRRYISIVVEKRIGNFVFISIARTLS